MSAPLNPKYFRRKLREDLRKKKDSNAPVKKMRKEVRKMRTAKKR